MAGGVRSLVIAAFAKRPVAKLDPEVLDVLRMTAFQLLHLDRIPASAAVNDAVNLVSKAGKKSASGLVNAVLRRISRERGSLPLPRTASRMPRDRAGGARLPLDGTLSHPRVARAAVARSVWVRGGRSLGAVRQQPGAADASRQHAPHIAGCAAAAVAAARGRDRPDPLRARRARRRPSGNPLLTPLADSGLFIVQDEASQLVAQLTGAAPGERILDACASPGGKTTAMAAAMGNRGLIVATDVRGRRVDLLRAGRCGPRARPACASCRPTRRRCCPSASRFDCVLLDAPCSGLGTLRRDPDIRWRRTRGRHSDGSRRRRLAMLGRAAAVVCARRPADLLRPARASRRRTRTVVSRFLDGPARISRPRPSRFRPHCPNVP